MYCCIEFLLIKTVFAITQAAKVFFFLVWHTTFLFGEFVLTTRNFAYLYNKSYANIFECFFDLLSMYLFCLMSKLVL